MDYIERGYRRHFEGRPGTRPGVREAGALWLGVREDVARTAAVVFLNGEGVEASRGRWKVSPEVFGVVTRWAKPRGLCLLGVVHTHLHGVPARLSRADREHNVQVPGVLAVVIGEGGWDEDHTIWGWYVYENQDYRPILVGELKEKFDMSSGKVELLGANAEGMWEIAKDG